MLMYRLKHHQESSLTKHNQQKNFLSDYVVLFHNIFITGSIPKAIAGKVSVIKLIHKICVGNNGIGQNKIIETKIVTTSPKLQESKRALPF